MPGNVQISELSAGMRSFLRVFPFLFCNFSDFAAQVEPLKVERRHTRPHLKIKPDTTGLFTWGDLETHHSRSEVG